MFDVWGYLRRKAYEAVTAGICDALDAVESGDGAAAGTPALADGLRRRGVGTAEAGLPAPAPAERWEGRRRGGQ